MERMVWLVSVVLIGAGGGICDAAGRGHGAGRVVVLAYNYARIPGSVMSAARAKAIAIYRNAGVDVDWVERLSANSDTHDAFTGDAFTVRVLIRTGQAEWSPTKRSVMGMALAGDRRSAVVSLFFDEVSRVARRYEQPPADVLAIAIAHELGHVLLPSPSHTTTGIMRGVWDGDDVQHAFGEPLVFTAEQAALMRDKLNACCAGRKN